MHGDFNGLGRSIFGLRDAPCCSFRVSFGVSVCGSVGVFADSLGGLVGGLGAVFGGISGGLGVAFGGHKGINGGRGGGLGGCLSFFPNNDENKCFFD